MRGDSELQQLLRQHQAEGKLESSGRFTLDRDKALAKLAAFQMPRPGGWILKIVQAAVLAGASELRIVQTNFETRVTFRPRERWDREQVKRELLDPEVSASASFDSFKRGVWSAVLNSNRVFRLVIPRSDQALAWVGGGLVVQAAPIGEELQLAVSHSDNPTTNQINAVAIADTIEVLRESAFVCPIPLKLDQRRLDVLQLCPSHGCTPCNYPLLIAFAQAESPGLTVPSGTFGTFSREGGANEVTRHLTTKLAPLQSTQVSNLTFYVTAHLGKQFGLKGYVWHAKPSDSYLYWVKDGVVVDRRTLPIAKFAVSCALVVSAEGLETDVSGLKLIESPEKRARQLSCYRAAWPLLQATQLELEGFLKAERHDQVVSKTAVVGVAGFLSLVVLVPGMLAAGAGLLATKLAGEAGVEAVQQLGTDLRKLKQSFQELTA